MELKISKKEKEKSKSNSGFGEGSIKKEKKRQLRMKIKKELESPPQLLHDNYTEWHFEIEEKKEWAGLQSR